MDVVEEDELISLESITSIVLHDEVSFNQLNDGLLHWSVLLNVVLASEHGVFSHLDKDLCNLVVLYFQRMHVEGEGRDLLPVLSLEDNEHLCDIIWSLKLLLVLLGWERRKDIADLGHVLDVLLLEGFLTELRHVMTLLH